MSGKKRSKKGIESLEKQIAFHIEKLKSAKELGNIGLANYGHPMKYPQIA